MATKTDFPITITPENFRTAFSSFVRGEFRHINLIETNSSLFSNYDVVTSNYANLPISLDTLRATLCSDNGGEILLRVLEACYVRRTLNITIGHQVTYPTSRSLLEQLTRRPMVNVTRLDFDIDLESMPPTAKINLGSQLFAVIHTLRYLQSLSFPGDLATQNLWGALSVLPSLKVLTMTPSKARTIEHFIPHPALTVGQFFRLKVLELPFSGPLEMVDVVPLVPSISHFTLSLCHYGLANEMAAAVQAMAKHWKNLTVLSVTIQTGAPNECKLNDFVQLTHVQSIVRLDLKHPWPMIYDDDDIRNFVSSWPLVKELYLNPRPSLAFPIDCGPLPSPNCLVALATCGPCIEKVAGLMDFRIARFPPGRNIGWRPTITLDLGFSVGPVEDRRNDDIALGILELFPDVTFEEEGCSPWVSKVRDALEYLRGTV